MADSTNLPLWKQQMIHIRDASKLFKSQKRIRQSLSFFIVFRRATLRSCLR